MSQFLSNRFVKNLLLLTVLGIALINLAKAKPLAQFTPPTQITFQLFALNEDGSRKSTIDPNTGQRQYFPCTQATSGTNDDTRQAYGCTYYDGGGGRPDKDSTKIYPFASSQVTIDIENYQFGNVQQSYLHNVVSQEMVEGATLSAYVAQAMTARTYTYFYDHTEGFNITNNSSSFHVYIPYRYEGVGHGLPSSQAEDRRTKIDNAIRRTAGQYLTQPSSLTPINARYGADNCTYTEQGYVDAEKTTKVAYLRSIFDPISGAANPDPCSNSATTFGTGNGGMSSKGAARWGQGNTAGPAIGGQTWPVQWGEEPGTIDGDSWRNSFQILAHYYSGIHIRNQAGSLQTPDLRWNTLDIRWSGSITPPKFVPGVPQSSEAMITVQNTGTGDWAKGGNRRYYLAYRWITDNQTGDKENPVQVVTNHTVSPGEHLPPIRLTVASPQVTTSQNYTLSIDMYYQDNDGPLVGFSQATSLPWFTHDIEFEADNFVICPQQVGACGGSSERYSYLPIIMKTKPRPPTATPVPSPTMTSISYTPTPTQVSANCWSENLLDKGAAENFDWPIGQSGTIRWMEVNLLGAGGVEKLSSLTSRDNYFSAPRALKLGGYDPDDNEQEAFDQYAFQHVSVSDPKTIRKIQIKYAYYFLTDETVDYVKDRFFVDLYNGFPQPSPGNNSPPKNSLLQDLRIEYNNLSPHKKEWRWRSNSQSDKNDGDLIAVIPSNAGLGQNIYLAFYSEIDQSLPSYLYIDNVQLRVCRE